MYPDVELTRRIIGACMEVHTALGPGLLESVYGDALCFEFSNQSIRFEREVPFPVLYKGVTLNTGLRADFVIEKRIILELKSSEQLAPIHEAQLFTYLKLSKMRVGLLVNFNTRRLKDGIRRRII